MSIKKYVKSRKKIKLFLFITIVFLIFFTIFILKTNSNSDFSAGPYFNVPQSVYDFEQRQIVPEKYNEGEVRARLIKDKITRLTQNKNDAGRPVNSDGEDEENRKPLSSITRNVHIFYSIPVIWYKGTRKSLTRLEGNTTALGHVLNIAFFPALGLYEPTEDTLRRHFMSIRNCGIGVIVIAAGNKLTEKLFKRVLDLVPQFNLTVTLELDAVQNKSSDYIRDQLLWARKFTNRPGFYKTFIATKNTYVPMIYIKNAHKINADTSLFCNHQPQSLRFTAMDGVYIGHIRHKEHTQIMKRLCFDGFYSSLPSNGATYASTWKNWSFLKSFAQSYRMLFIPTVGPGYSERNKLPRHGNIQRHRSNGRYYGVAWRTAISNHAGFISVASFNNWPEGTQIEEAISREGFSDYSPGKATKYLSLTTHWVDNYLKRIAKVQNNCQKFSNNTIC